MNLIIKPEEVENYFEVEKLITEAFSGVEHSDGSESQLVKNLRQAPSFHPELSLVAYKNNEVVGHVLLTPVSVGEYPALALAPISVAKAQQGQGIGKTLMEAAHKQALNLGYHLIIILGDPTYYGKFGYKPASVYGILAPKELPEEYFLAKFLDDKIKKLDGIVHYPKEFGISSH